MWADLPKAGYDCESTGLDVETDRIVSATVAAVGDGEPRVRSTIINPGMEIPAESVEIHGITNEQVQAEGKPPVSELEWIADDLTRTWTAGHPVVGMNLAYDLTLLDRELRRYALPTLEDRLGREVGPIIDIFVIDKAVDRWRPGKRRLEHLCEVYGVRHDGAHDARHDTIAAARVAWRMGRMAVAGRDELMRHYAHRSRRNAAEIAYALTSIGRMSLAELHEAQRGWYAEQALGFAAHLRKLAAQEEHQADQLDPGDPARETAYGEAAALRQRADEVPTEWPIRPWTGGAPC